MPDIDPAAATTAADDLLASADTPPADVPGTNGSGLPRYSGLLDHPLPDPKYRRGKEVVLADERKYWFAPLQLRQTRQGGILAEAFGRVVNSGALVLGGMLFASDASLEDVLLIMQTALSRNYPDITRDDCIDLLDTACVYEVISCVFNLGGFRDMLQKMGIGPPPVPGTLTR